MEREKLPVIFRKSAYGVTAYFPTIPADCDGCVTCYAHIGQHGAASPHMLTEGKPATPEEYNDLLHELRSIYERGPDAVQLVVRKRVTRDMAETRRREARKWR